MLFRILSLIVLFFILTNYSYSAATSTGDTESYYDKAAKLIKTAKKQDKILRENNQFMVQITELSKKTFHISPEIAKKIGKTKDKQEIISKERYAA